MSIPSKAYRPIPHSTSESIDGLYFSPPHTRSPSRRVRRSLTLSGVLFFAAEVNTTTRAVRSAFTVVVQVFTFNKEWLSYCRYLKFVASFRGVLKIRKILQALNVILDNEPRPVRIRAGWHAIKYSKTVARSVAWFATIFSDFGWIAPKNVGWARAIDRVHLPFQVVATTLALIRLCKVGLILFELNMYKSDVKLAASYMAEYSNKLADNLEIGLDYRLDKKTRTLNKYVLDVADPKHEKANRLCAEVFESLIEKANNRFRAESLNSAIKVLSLGSTVLDTTMPIPFFYASIYSLVITALKTTKYIMNRPEIDYTKTP